MYASLKKEIIEWLVTFAVALAIMGIFNLFFTLTMVFSTSMYPTLIEKDLLFMQRTQNVQAGDIISFDSELLMSEGDIERLNILQRLFVNTSTSKKLIKRVIAVPGDSILIEEEKVYINGKRMEEIYVSSPTTGYVDIDKVPEGQYFCMGDNRSMSLDSRSAQVGMVDQDRIIGKALFRFFPLTRIGKVH